MKEFLRAPLLESRQDSPWQLSFFHLCRWLEARAHPLPRIGEDAHPCNEYCRLGQEPSTAFAAREIASLQHYGDTLRIKLNGLGLYGPNGPLPLHITEEAHERNIQKRDSTLTDFLDMFHHRWLALFYRAWAMGQSAAGLDRQNTERFSFYVASLIGHDTANNAKTPFAPHARLAAISHLVVRSRYPAGLTATCSQFWNLPFRLEEYHFHWLELDTAEQSRLGGLRCSCRLGYDAVLGKHVPDRQSMFVLHLGPVTLKDYKRFLPTGTELPRLVAWVREFVGVEIRWMLQLSLLAYEVPCSCIGGTGQLGRSTWLGRKNLNSVVCSKLFSPERTLQRMKKRGVSACAAV